MSDNVLFLVRSVVADAALRAKFDHWYATEHLPLALAVLGAERAWRAWSTDDPAVHYAGYRCASMQGLQTALASDGFKGIVAEYDRAWPAGVTRTREILRLAEERAR